MIGYIVIIAIGALALIVLTEIVAAAVPLIIVITMVPPHEREGLARLLAACDSSRRLRLWPALRLAVEQHREQVKRQTTSEVRVPQSSRPPARAL